MNARESAIKALYLVYGIVAAEFYPVGIKGEAHFIRRKLVGKIFHTGLSVYFVGVLLRMVMIHKEQSRVRYLLSRRKCLVYEGLAKFGDLILLL